jgi:monothiol glutaredoxin
MTPEIQKRIEILIQENDVVLFMKGTKNSPHCGFSGAVVSILNALKVPFKDIDVLEDMELREGIKTFTSWPTLPQLYIKKEFIGGADIVRELFKSGKLYELLDVNAIPHQVRQ